MPRLPLYFFGIFHAIQFYFIILRNEADCLYNYLMKLHYYANTILP